MGPRQGLHLALSLCLLAAAFAELRLESFVLRRQVLQLLLQSCAFCLHTVQQVAVDVVLGRRTTGRSSRSGWSWYGQGFHRGGPCPFVGLAYLCFQFHHPLPPFAAIGQSLCFTQTHSHELILKLSQDQLPWRLLPAATTGKMGLERRKDGRVLEARLGL